MKEMIKIENLKKSFGKFQALKDVTFTVNAGEVVGFLGPNGAGKSTTIRTLLGLLKKDSGTVTIFGQDVFTAADAIHEKIAYVPGETNVWDNMRGGDILALFAKLRKNVNLDKQAELIQAFHFDINKKAKAYSKGNKQKIALISALATEADLYIFDEPTSGLDPLMENVFQTEVKRLKQAGKAILLSSHILSEVEKLADTIVIIKDGEIIERGSLQELKSITQSKMTVTTASELSSLGDFSSVSQLQISGNTATFLLDDTGVAAVMSYLAAQEIIKIATQKPTLDELFMDKYAEGGDAR
ncbi:MAG: ATP-binding cassette domain-containing protein [Lactococcus sp.]|jgi:ABC-2 type transport system ATP-binding protein